MHIDTKKSTIMAFADWHEIGFDISYSFKPKTLWLQFLFWHLTIDFRPNPHQTERFIVVKGK
jgi:hypothetical protein